MTDLTSLVAEPEIPTLREKEKEERRGAGAPVGFMGRTTGVVLEAGTTLPGAGFNSLFWGLNGRGGFLAVASALFGRIFTPGELAFLATGTLSLLALTVLGLSRYLNDGGDRSTARIAWEAQDPTNGFGVAGGLPQEAARPMVGDMVHLDDAAKAVDTLPAAPVLDAPKAAAAEPQAEVKVEVPNADEIMNKAVPAMAQTKLVGGSFGGASGGRFGGGDLRDSLGAFPGVKSMGNAPALKELQTQSLAAMSKARRVTSAAFPKASRVTAGRAMGQLKFADRQSVTALGSTTIDPARNFAASAFEQSQIRGAAGNPIGGAGMGDGGTMGPLGSGAPDVTAPPTNNGVNKTPYQSKADDAKKGVDMAKMLTILGLALLAAGAAVLMMAKKMAAMAAAQAATAAAMGPAGAAMAAAAAALKAKAAMMKMLGIALLIAGAAAIAAGMMMKKKADDDAKSIAEDSGQKDQGKTIHTCADQAVVPAGCHPAPFNQPGNSVHHDVVVESNSTYQNGGPIGR